MKIAICRLESLSPYSQSGFHQTPAKDKEAKDDFEKRTWREKGHYNERNQVVIPPMAFKGCIQDAAKFLSLRIPGKGKATWTKNFKAGILVVEGIELPETKETVLGEWNYCNADGVRGSGTRVMRCFPIIQQWKGEVKFHILDNAITEDVFKMHLSEAGSLIGIGRFRPQNGGFYGRFAVKSVIWSE